MNWKEIEILKNYFNVRTVDLARFIGNDESTIRKNIKESREFKAKQAVVDKVLVLFLSFNRSIENLEQLVTDIKNGNSFNYTSKKYVESRILINNEFNKTRDNQLAKQELFLSNISLSDGVEHEKEIDNDYIKLLQMVRNRPGLLKQFVSEEVTKTYKEIDMTKSIILSFNINYDTYSTEYPRPVIKDFHLKIPTVYSSIKSKVQLLVTNRDGNTQDEFVKLFDDIDINDEDINSLRDKDGYIGFKEFTLWMNKIFKKYLQYSQGGFIVFTDQFDDELYFLKNHLDKYGKSIFNKIPILLLN